MAFTAAQLTTIKAAILADGTLTGYVSTNPHAIVDYFNTIAAPDFPVWQTRAPIVDIFNAIDFSKFTPTDVPSTVDLPSTSATFLSRSQSILIKQANLLTFLKHDTLDFSKVNVRAGLRDSVIALPAGASGASVSAAGASAAILLTAGTRLGTRLEKLLTTGPQITGSVTADVMGWEGKMTDYDVPLAMNGA